MQENKIEPVLSATTVIRARRVDVWARLVDIVGWPRWSTLVSRVEGEVRPGGALHLWVAQGTPQARDFTGVVTTIEAPTLLATEGGVPGQLYGHHRYVLSGPDGAVEVLDEERYSGALVDAVLAASRDVLLAEFVQFLADLKAACEA